MTLQTHPQTREMVFDLEHFFRSHIFKTTLYLDCFFMGPFPLKVGRQAHPQSIFHARLSCSPWKIQKFPENLKKFKRGSKRWNNWNKLKQLENSWTTWKGHTFFVCCLCLLCFVLFFQHVPTFFNILHPFPSCFDCFYCFQDSFRVKTEQTRQYYQRGRTPAMQLPESSHPGTRTSRLNLDAMADQ